MASKLLKQNKRTEARLRNEWIMENVDELYKNYYNAYKSHYDTDDKLSGAKKRVWLQTIWIGW